MVTSITFLALTSHMRVHSDHMITRGVVTHNWSIKTSQSIPTVITSCTSVTRETGWSMGSLITLVTSLSRVTSRSLSTRVTLVCISCYYVCIYSNSDYYITSSSSR